jgi:hypothetical protein
MCCIDSPINNVETCEYMTEVYSFMNSFTCKLFIFFNASQQTAIDLSSHFIQS